MTFWEKLKSLLPSQRRTRESDMQEELESLQAMAKPNELGNLTRAAENARDAWTWRWLECLVQDLRYAFRAMSQHKAFTILAIASLALGIGANTAIFSFMDSILLRSLAVPNPETLVVMKWRAVKGFTSASSKGMSWSTDGSYKDGDGYVGTSFPYPALQLFLDNHDVLSSAFCYYGISRVSVTARDETEAVRGQYVSGNYFEGMGVRPSAGRLIEAADDVEGSAAVAVLSHRFSERRFGSVDQAIGQTVRLNDLPFTVVGVAPADFFGAEPAGVPDAYIPMRAIILLQPPRGTQTVAQQFAEPNFYWLEIMARLKPGVTLSQAQAALAPQFHRFAEDTTSTASQRSNLPDLTIEQGGAGLDSLRRRYSKPLYVLMTMVALILLIACANIANLLLARAVARRREIAIRVSIGAGRLRIIRQLLTESLLLALIGGLLGVFFARWGIEVLTLLLANGRENFTLHAELNWHVLLIALGLSCATGLLFGLAPALQATRADVMPALKDEGASLFGRTRRIWSRLSLSNILVVTQVTISLLLLVAAGLFGRTLSNLHAIETGFNRDNILLFSINAGTAGYKDAALGGIYEDLRSRLSQVAGVHSVSLSAGALPSGGGSMAVVQILGEPVPPPLPNGERSHSAVVFSVGPEFFETMAMPRIAGRDFTAQDKDGAPKVIVVNQHFAQMFKLPNPVGHTMILGKDSYEIVGLVPDALSFDLKEERRPVAYFPYLQGRIGGMTYEIRTAAGNPMNYASAVRQIVHQLDTRLAISDLQTQGVHIDQAISSEIALARLCSVFAGLALVIACVGLYGTVTFNIVRRTREIGIRMALGARGPRILWMVLREVLVMSLIGLAIGLPLVLAGSRFVKSFLYGIAANDPVAITLAILVLLLSAATAGYIPARRASRIDPLDAVRHD